MKGKRSNGESNPDRLGERPDSYPLDHDGLMGNKSLNYLLKRRRYNVCTMYLCSAAKNAPGVPRGVKERPWGPFFNQKLSVSGFTVPMQAIWWTWTTWWTWCHGPQWGCGLGDRTPLWNLRIVNPVYINLGDWKILSEWWAGLTNLLLITREVASLLTRDA